MSNRKEEILIVALHLFARDGYEAVSVSQIAGELGMTKGALYRHYKSKRDIFDCIVQRMEQQDREQASDYDMPEEDREEMPEKYEAVSLDDFAEYSKSMFEYWTEDDFASSFRKMLTIEQFRSGEMQKLYQQYDLKRVFYSAYVPLNEDSNLPALGTAPPLLREHRLYQADWLLRFYGFKADELLSVDRPNFNTMLDPKCDWALRHLDIYPVEINRASYDVLLRVPGIGTKSAFRIVKARKHGTLNFEHLKKMGIVLKRAKYFITCSGKMMYRIPIEEDFITRQLIGEDGKQNWEIDHPQTYRQLSLFDDFNFQSEVTVEDSSKTLFGQM